MLSNPSSIFMLDFWSNFLDESAKLAESLVFYFSGMIGSLFLRIFPSLAKLLTVSWMLAFIWIFFWYAHVLMNLSTL